MEILTKEQAIEYFKDVENITGLEAMNVRDLHDDSTQEQIQEARGWFKGLANEILTNV